LAGTGSGPQVPSTYHPDAPSPATTGATGNGAISGVSAGNGFTGDGHAGNGAGNGSTGNGYGGPAVPIGHAGNGNGHGDGMTITNGNGSGYGPAGNGQGGEPGSVASPGEETRGGMRRRVRGAQMPETSLTAGLGPNPDQPADDGPRVEQLDRQRDSLRAFQHGVDQGARDGRQVDDEGDQP